MANGTRVKYSRAFLTSINAQAYQELYQMRGTVTEQGKTYGTNLTTVRVRWDGDDRDRLADIKALTAIVS